MSPLRIASRVGFLTAALPFVPAAQLPSPGHAATHCIPGRTR